MSNASSPKRIKTKDDQLQASGAATAASKEAEFRRSIDLRLEFCHRPPWRVVLRLHDVSSKEFPSFTHGSTQGELVYKLYSILDNRIANIRTARNRKN